MTLVLPSLCPNNSGPIQWACGGGVDPSAAARPNGLRWKKKPMHLSLLYDHCLATQHPWVKLTQQQLEAEMEATLEEGEPQGPIPKGKKIQKTRGREIRARKVKDPSPSIYDMYRLEGS